MAKTANAMLKNLGFYVGDERTVPISAKTAASWLTIASDSAGSFAITADPVKIQKAVDGLKEQIDRKAADSTVITNSDDEVIRTVIAGGDGRELGDTSGVAQGFADQLATGNGVYALPVKVTPATETKLQRLLEVDLGEQRLYLRRTARSSTPG